MARVVDAGPDAGFDKRWKAVQDSSGRIVPVVIQGDAEGNVAAPRRSAFGELSVAEPYPQAQQKWTTGLLPLDTNADHVSGSATITATDSILSVSTGTTTGSIARMMSRDAAHYSPGQGVEARFTALFTTGVAGTSQIAGVGDAGDALGFGYDGASFGVVRRTGGQSEIRTLTVTSASTGVGTITVTLNSGSGVAVSISGALSIGEVAREIANADYSGEGGGWVAFYAGNRVVFQSVDSGSHAGTYSFAAGATGAAGSIAQTVAGVAASDTWVAQADWNLDPADGTRRLPALAPTKGTPYAITYQWLGYGAITYSIEDPITGDFVPVHRIRYANANTAPSLRHPDLPLMVETNNGATTSDIVTQTASMGVFSFGQQNGRGLRFSTSGLVNTDTTRVMCLAIRSNVVQVEGHTSHVRVQLDTITYGNSGAKVAEFRVYRNPTIVGSPTWTNVDASNSQMQYCTSAATLTGGTRLESALVSATGSQYRQYDEFHTVILRPGDILAVDVALSSGAAADMQVGFGWREEI